MSLLVSLPMYDAPPLALTGFWRGLRRHLAREGVTDAPGWLASPQDLDAHWRDDNLLLSQTCGRPLATTLRAKVALVGTPHYGAPGCDGPNYRSLVLVRDQDRAGRLADLRGRVAAINGRDSQSGYAQFARLVAPLDDGAGFFSGLVETGSHLASLEAVRRREADVAAVDCVTFALAARDRPHTVEGLKVVARTPPAPGLPFVTALSTGADRIARMRRAIAAAIVDPALADDRAALMLTGLSVPPIEDYERLGAAPDLVIRPSVPPFSAKPALGLSPC